MKLAHITTSNFLGARAVDLRLTKPVALIAGKNGAGKSSIMEAVRMAMTGEPVRVSLKKEYATLLTEETSSGFADVEVDGVAHSIVLPSGKGSGSDLSPTLPYVLDAQRFARMDDSERRAFLFGLMGVKTDGAAIKERLLAKGCDVAKVEQVFPILRAGFDAAAKEAASKARDAKASWKTATGGDTWGKEKAAKWQPPELPIETDKAQTRYENAKSRLLDTDKELAAVTQELGAAKAEQRRQQNLESRRAALRTLADNVDRYTTKLNLDTAELAAWEEKVAVCRAAAGGKPNPKAPGEFLLRGLASVTSDFLELSCKCPEVEWPEALINRAATHLAEYRKLHGEPVEELAKSDPEAIAKLPEYENALRLMKSSVENGKRNLESAKAAAAELAAIDNGTTTENVEALEQKVADLTATRNNWQADMIKYRDMADLSSRRHALIQQVTKLHADVMGWTEISDALSPDGIPGELLSEALGPINERLRLSASDAEWEPAQINADMTITYGLRNYSLISESEKWRTDAMIAEAVSRISGLKLLVLDRFDVLDMKGREDLLYWLDGMAEDGDIDTALIFGTLKSLPALNFATIDCFWIENGVAGQLKEAA